MSTGSTPRSSRARRSGTRRAGGRRPASLPMRRGSSRSRGSPPPGPTLPPPPRPNTPPRTKQNTVSHPRLHVYKYGPAQSLKSAKTKSGAYGLLKTLYMIEFIKTMIRESKSSTLREMYYISEGWDLAKFETQDESNSVAEDLEIVAKAMREDFKLRPEENGASVIGNITIVERNRKGELKTINCRDDVGDSGYALPFNVEKEKIQIKDFDAKFLCAIETGGMFDRLVENGFDEKFDAVLG